MTETILEVKNLRFSYPDLFEAVKGISFSIQAGESVGVIGANGAGKSTLLLLLVGILLADSGQIHVKGVQVTKKTLAEIRRSVGLVFQDPDDQLFMTTVYDDVAFGPRNEKLDEQEVDMRVEKALESVGISHLKEKAPFKLSGGEKRSAAIASVLSMLPDILIMDEPTAALDPKSRRRVIHLLNSFRQTKIITSHDLDMIWDTCARVIVIQDGQVAADGKTAEILTNEALLDRCGLELPLSLRHCPRCGTAKIGASQN